MKPRESTQQILASPLALRKFLTTIDRERKYLQSELVEVKGLMPLLMKPRNRMNWSEEDKRELHGHLRRLRHLSPYIVVFVLPGGMAMVPVLAWWLDRRRGRRVAERA